MSQLGKFVFVRPALFAIETTASIVCLVGYQDGKDEGYEPENALKYHTALKYGIRCLSLRP